MSNTISFLSRIYIPLFLLILFQCKPVDDSFISITVDDRRIEIHNSNIQLVFDELMYSKIYFHQNEKILSINDNGTLNEESRPSHFIRLDGKIYKNFNIISHLTKDINDEQYGKGKILIIKGLDADIEKSLHVEMYEEFPDIAISWSTYTNKSNEDLTIDDVYYNYYRLDRKLTKPEAESFDFRYLQPLNKKWGDSWINLGITDSTQEDFVIPGSGSNRSGIPFIDVWGEEMGMAVFHVEGKPRFLHVLLDVKKDHKVDMGLSVKPEDSYGQFPTVLKKDSSITTWKSAVCVH
ncbi:hypothetical protein ACFLU5_06750, partial [Bacteroidota bacterium]